VIEARVLIRGVDDRLRLFGRLDANLGELEKRANVGVTVDGDEIVVAGAAEDVAVATSALDEVIAIARSGAEVRVADVSGAVKSAREDRGHPGDAGDQTLATSRSGRAIRARSPGQRRLVAAVRNHTLTLAIGPAGTGKTFLAVVLAVAALRAGEASRIVLSRPAVEAGENLGFLPGDLAQKVDPYLRPLFDALDEMMEPAAWAKAVERGQIEIAPLAYMRGRTLRDSFVVLDEGQNTTREQMKMFLTRIGPGSRMIVCGDVTQIDIERPERSGLVHAARIFDSADDIAVVSLGDEDVVRHPLIRRIIGAYGRGAD
jgi:phosphate starvation-inducible protein PhoH and related proteins